ncbi:hypothetical protein BREV_BREV_01463 [Brevundimonas mediterranea]|uniref:Uncharacterized protein n=1 Tax=Brevundimonas mediterranea TaxID=74329 RepID=A0A7Z9C5F8_9CAUL|nr:hypothetical protein BREV_BREV_01463 [Brevundimonas mediterranea]
MPDLGHHDRQGDRSQTQGDPAIPLHVAPDRLAPDDAEAEDEGPQRQGVIVPVPVQDVRHPEPGEQQDADGDQVEDRQDQHLRSRQRLLQPRAHLVDQARPTPQQHGDDAVGGDIDDEPQVVDRNPVGQAAPTELMHHPGGETRQAAGPAGLVHRLDPRLDRHQDHGAEQQGRDQSREPGARHLARTAPEGHEPQRRPGHQEQQGQPPGIGDENGFAHPLEGVDAVHMPAVDPVDQADMIQDQQAKGPDPDPVQIIAARGRGSRGGHGRVYDPADRFRQYG